MNTKFISQKTCMSPAPQILARQAHEELYSYPRGTEWQARMDTTPTFTSTRQQKLLTPARCWLHASPCDQAADTGWVLAARQPT